MPTYPVTVPSGKIIDIDADSPEEAGQRAKEQYEKTQERPDLEGQSSDIAKGVNRGFVEGIGNIGDAPRDGAEQISRLMGGSNEDIPDWMKSLPKHGQSFDKMSKLLGGLPPPERGMGKIAESVAEVAPVAAVGGAAGLGRGIAQGAIQGGVRGAAKGAVKPLLNYTKGLVNNAVIPGIGAQAARAATSDLGLSEGAQDRAAMGAAAFSPRVIRNATGASSGMAGRIGGGILGALGAKFAGVEPVLGLLVGENAGQMVGHSVSQNPLINLLKRAVPSKPGPFAGPATAALRAMAVHEDPKSHKE